MPRPLPPHPGGPPAGRLHAGAGARTGPPRDPLRETTPLSSARRTSRPRCAGSRPARGQALVETAIGIVLLLLLTFSIVDAAMLFYVYLTLENGVTEATRFAVTGQQENDPSNPTSPLSREDSIKHVMRNSTPGLMLLDSEFSFYDVTHRRSGTGGPSDVIQVTVTHPWRL